MTPSASPAPLPVRVDGRPPWPASLQQVFERFVTCEYATLTRAGTPVTWPVTPYVTARTLDVSCGLAYPSKAERARLDPRVALSFSSPVGSGLAQPSTVLVQGLATVRDADLQANTDRYVDVALAKLPDVYAGVPAPLLERLMDWYWPRIWIEVTPLRIAWWPSGDLAATPRTWTAPAATAAPPSDPPPRGTAPKGSTGPPGDVGARLDAALRLGHPVVTTTDADGWPLPLRARSVRRIGPGRLEVSLPTGTEVGAGPVCVTFHDHPERFDRQQNTVFVGSAEPLADGLVEIGLERVVGGFALPGGSLRRVADVLRSRRRLRPRAAIEARRRGQPVPRARLPRGPART